MRRKSGERYGARNIRPRLEIFLVDRVQHRACRLLDDLVFKCGNCEGALLNIGLRYRARGSIRRCRDCSSSTESKASSKAIRRSFGREALIQRYQIHKARNIMERLPNPLHADTIGMVAVASLATRAAFGGAAA